MAEYIERDSLILDIEANKLMAREPAAKRILQMIENQHTADVRPERHGGWVFSEKLETLGMTIYKCSECGGELSPSRAEKSEWINNPRYAYCSYCGAKMDGKDGNKND